MAGKDWGSRANKRDLTLYKGADRDLSASLGTRTNGVRSPWIPPIGTVAYFLVWPPGVSVPVRWDCDLIDSTFTVHLEADVLDLIPADSTIHFYVALPDTPGGNPQCVTTGRIKRVDPR